MCLGNGMGGFTCSDVSTDENYTRSVALGFVDGDENLDAVFANTAAQRNRVCLGDGAGGFTCSDVSADEDSTYRVALGFVDGDENLDAVFANSQFQRNRVCLGDGMGGFTCSDVSTDENVTRRVALGFVDGDQNLDAVFAKLGHQEESGVSWRRYGRALPVGTSVPTSTTLWTWLWASSLARLWLPSLPTASSPAILPPGPSRCPEPDSP